MRLSGSVRSIEPNRPVALRLRSRSVILGANPCLEAEWPPKMLSVLVVRSCSDAANRSRSE